MRGAHHDNEEEAGETTLKYQRASGFSTIKFTGACHFTGVHTGIVPGSIPGSIPGPNRAQLPRYIPGLYRNTYRGCTGVVPVLYRGTYRGQTVVTVHYYRVIYRDCTAIHTEVHTGVHTGTKPCIITASFYRDCTVIHTGLHTGAHTGIEPGSNRAILPQFRARARSSYEWRPPDTHNDTKKLCR